MEAGEFKVPAAALGRRKRQEIHVSGTGAGGSKSVATGHESTVISTHHDASGQSDKLSGSTPLVNKEDKDNVQDDATEAKPPLAAAAAAAISRTDQEPPQGDKHDVHVHSEHSTQPVKPRQSSRMHQDSPPPVPYTVPHWSGPQPSRPFSLSVIKSGTIIEEVDISEKPYVVFGRLSTCDVHLEHPSISRYHAILQYRPPSQEQQESEEADREGGGNEIQSHTLFSTNPKDPGYYIYDLGSTHGTYLNKTRIDPRCYYRVRIGQMMKFGGSSRLFLLEVTPKYMYMRVHVHVYSHYTCTLYV